MPSAFQMKKIAHNRVKKLHLFLKIAAAIVLIPIAIVLFLAIAIVLLIVIGVPLVIYYRLIWFPIDNYKHNLRYKRADKSTTLRSLRKQQNSITGTLLINCEYSFESHPRILDIWWTPASLIPLFCRDQPKLFSTATAHARWRDGWCLGHIYTGIGDTITPIEIWEPRLDFYLNERMPQMTHVRRPLWRIRTLKKHRKWLKISEDVMCVYPDTPPFIMPLCPNCKYDTQQLATFTCPECGWDTRLSSMYSNSLKPKDQPYFDPHIPEDRLERRQNRKHNTVGT